MIADDEEPTVPTLPPTPPSLVARSPSPSSQPPPLVLRSDVEAEFDRPTVPLPPPPPPPQPAPVPGLGSSIWTPKDFIIPPETLAGPPPERPPQPVPAASIWTPQESIIPVGGTAVSPIRTSGRKRKASPRFSAPFPAKKLKPPKPDRKSAPNAGAVGPKGKKIRGRPRKYPPGQSPWDLGKTSGLPKGRPSAGQRDPTAEAGPSNDDPLENSMDTTMETTRDSIPDDDSTGSSLIGVGHFLINGQELLEEELPFQIGDLVWASVNSYAYWPAIVCQEYSSGTHFELRAQGLYQKPQYHVMYLCDKNRCNWVSAGKIIHFQGIKAFESFKEKKLAAAKGKLKKGVLRLFTVNPRYLGAYNQALKTAEAMLTKTRQERCNQLLVLNQEDEAVMVLPSPGKEPAVEVQEPPARPESRTRAQSLPPTEKRGRPSKEAQAKQTSARSVSRNKEQIQDPEPSTSSSVAEKPPIPSVFGLGSIIPKFDRRKEKLCVLCEGWIAEEKSSVDLPPNDPKDPNELRVPLSERGILCAGACGKSYHRRCLLESMTGRTRSKGGRKLKSKKPIDFSEDQLEALEPYTCHECVSGKPACFICHLVDIPAENPADAVVVKCSYKGCKKAYHKKCVSRPEWQQGSMHGEKLICPLHKCHTCAMTNPDNSKSTEKSFKLLQCTKCPTAYHYGVECSPAGAHYLGGNYMVCPKLHGKQKESGALNVNWCFLCGHVGGNMICCDVCPGSFHYTCLPYEVDANKDYLCEDCEAGKMPMHDDVVWAKMGHYRWWPAVIVHPEEVPVNVRALHHVPGQFPVRFFGTGEYFWADRTRVCHYMPDDGNNFVKDKTTGQKGKYGSKMDQRYIDGVKEAEEAVKARQAKLDERKQQEEASGNSRQSKFKPPPYAKIKVNKPYGRVKPVELNESNVQSCDCDPNGDVPCGPESNCINRSLLMECHPSVCRAGDRCGNQRFHRRQYPKLEPFPTGGKGWGLRALEDIKEGDFVIEYVGELIDDEEYERRIALKRQINDRHFYFLTLDNNRIIDAGPKGNLARFMNHSCEPNCATQKWVVAGDDRVGLFALRDVPAGQELTFNYKLESYSKSEEKRVCECKAPSCPGFIGAKVSSRENGEENGEEPKRKSQPVGKRKKKLVSKEDTCRYCCELVTEETAVFCSDCPRSYHIACLEKRNLPFTREEGKKWRCPWHFCDEPGCKAEAEQDKYSCDHCPGSFCREHGEQGEKIVWLGKLGFVCKKHSKTAVETLVNLITPEVVFGIGQRRSLKKPAK